MTKRKDLGKLLRNARTQKQLSQTEVAQHLKLNSPQSISDWERNYGSGIPVPSLKQLIKLYGLNSRTAYEALLDFQFSKLETSLEKEFFGKKK